MSFKTMNNYDTTALATSFGTSNSDTRPVESPTCETQRMRFFHVGMTFVSYSDAFAVGAPADAALKTRATANKTMFRNTSLKDTSKIEGRIESPWVRCRRRRYRIRTSACGAETAMRTSGSSTDTATFHTCFVFRLIDDCLVDSRGELRCYR